MYFLSRQGSDRIGIKVFAPKELYDAVWDDVEKYEHDIVIMEFPWHVVKLSEADCASLREKWEEYFFPPM